MFKLHSHTPRATPEKLSKSLTLLLGVAVGIIAANLYYAQPLTALIGTSLGIAAASAGLVVTLTQFGYGVGVLFLVPLADLIENRKLILAMISLATISILGIALSQHVVPYFISTFFLGVGASAVQTIIPYASHLSPEATRGKVVGSLMSGLMLGIMLSRPIAGVLSDWMSWHAVFFLSSAMMALLAFALYFFLPLREPKATKMRYKDLLFSMVQVAAYPTLQRRSIYQALMFAAFCLFWTATPLLLAGPEFHFSQSAIAVFALIGVGGAIVAPLAGRAADRGWIHGATILCMILGSVSFLITLLAPLGSTASIVLLTLAALLLDAGVTANLVLGQREIFLLPAELRGRINSIYIAIIFIGGALGSYVGAWAYAHGAWSLTSAIGFVIPLTGLMFFFTKKRHLKFMRRLL